MSKSIILDVSQPDREHQPGKIDGYNYFWAYYVDGYDSSTHCQPCFKGSPIPEFNSSTARTGQEFTFDKMDKHKFVYVCGVASGPVKERSRKNFHLALAFAEGRLTERAACADCCAAPLAAPALPAAAPRALAAVP